MMGDCEAYKMMASGVITGILQAGLFLDDDTLGRLLNAWAWQTEKQLGREVTAELGLEALQIAEHFKPGYALRIAAMIQPPEDN